MKTIPLYRETSVNILPERNEEGCFATVEYNHKDVLFRAIKLIENENGDIYVEYPTRKRVKNGQPVFNRYGDQVIDYIFRPARGCGAYYDTAIMNAYNQAEGSPLIPMDDIPFDETTKVINVCKLSFPMSKGFVGFAEIRYRGMEINDIAILRSYDDDYHLVFPHYKESRPDGKLVKKLFIYPQKEELKNIKDLILDSYFEL